MKSKKPKKADKQIIGQSILDTFSLQELESAVIKKKIDIVFNEENDIMTANKLSSIDSILSNMNYDQRIILLKKYL